MSQTYVVVKYANTFAVKNVLTGARQSFWKDSRKALAVARDLNRSVK